MATEHLIRALPRELTLGVVELDGGNELAAALQAQGIGKVLGHHSAQELLASLERSAMHVVILSLTRTLTAGVELLGSLTEDSCPPRTIVLLEAEPLRQKLSAQLPAGCQPHLVLVKPVPLPELVAAITEQAGLWMPLARKAAQEQRSFPEVLAELWHTRRTGVLRVISAEQSTTIYLRQGRPIFAEHGNRADMLGRILVESGRITEEQLSRAVDLVTHRPVQNEQLQLGGALVELGAISVDELYATLTTQVHRKILACFAVTNPSIEFREGEDLLEGISAFENSVPALLLAGISQKLPPPQIERFLARYLDERLICSAPVREIEQAFGLGGRDGRLLSLLTSGIELRTLYLRSPLAPERTQQLLIALILGKAVTVVSASAPEPPAAQPTEEQEQTPRTNLPYGVARKEPAPSGQAGWGRLRSLLGRTGQRDDE